MDDVTIKEELRWRREVSNIYTRQRDDFPSKEAWDDYLEEKEDLVFNLTYKDQGRFDEARQKLKRYAIEHQDEIAAAKARKADAQRGKLADAPDAGPSPADTSAANPFSMPVGAMGHVTASNPMPRLETRPPWINAELGILYDRKRPWPTNTDLLLELNAAGGWKEEISRKRSRQDAFTALFAISFSME